MNLKPQSLMLGYVNVRPASHEDTHRIAEIQIAAWRDTYRGEFPDEYLANLSTEERTEYWATVLDRTGSFGSRLIVASAEDAIGGFACFGPAFSEDNRGELYAMNVDPLYWRQSLGTRLLAATTRGLRELGLPDALLWVSQGNQRAQAFYRSQGWEPDGEGREDEIAEAEIRHLRMAKLL